MADSVAVLVAEDQGIIASLIEMTLLDGGLTPTVVTSGAEALTLLSQPTPFDMLVTDIRMEPGPDGWAVAVQAREGRPDILVIYITGDSMDDWRVKGVRGSLVIAKPFVPEQLLDAIRCLRDGAPADRL